MRRDGFEMPTSLSSSIVRSRARRRDILSCARSCSAICQPTVYTGVNAVIGSWKIIAISPPRTPRISRCDSRIRSRPRRSTSPSTTAFGSRINRITAIIETVLPDPDSPTTPTTSPSPTESERRSTARTIPFSVWNDTLRSRTSSSGSGTTHPRIEPCVDEIDDRVRNDDEKGGVDHGRQDHRQIEVLEGVARQLSDAVQAEHGVRQQHGAAHERADGARVETNVADQAGPLRVQKQ